MSQARREVVDLQETLAARYAAVEDPAPTEDSAPARSCRHRWPAHRSSVGERTAQRATTYRLTVPDRGFSR